MPPLAGMRRYSSLLMLVGACLCNGALAQGMPSNERLDIPTAPGQVEVRRDVGDDEVRDRLRQILETTGWYSAWTWP